ncbi:hypothetical protein T4C_6397 [Trichinella pseudospiralis]|uniref:Uncharacterized protein n=1 Tax=Trichinella pseudospiralis TaxID=6337 RepID=A0A0V1K398_TRIPS|nr:hypothetical protein T4C_6397 [Trichinella pseudospiralis]
MLKKKIVLETLQIKLKIQWLSGSIIDGGCDRLGRIVESDGISYGKRLDYLPTGPNCLHGRRFGHLRSFAFLRSAFRVAGA